DSTIIARVSVCHRVSYAERYSRYRARGFCHLDAPMFGQDSAKRACCSTDGACLESEQTSAFVQSVKHAPSDGLHQTTAGRDLSGAVGQNPVVSHGTRHLASQSRVNRRASAVSGAIGPCSQVVATACPWCPRADACHGSA